MLNQILATGLGYGTYSATSAASSAGIAAAFGTMLFAMLMPVLIMYIVVVIGMWKVFTKAGRPGWAAIIPIYNMYVITEISGQNGLLILINLIPGVGSIIWSIMVALKLAPAFGKDTGFAIGLILLGPIFYCILGFGSAQYTLGGGAPAAAGAQPATPAATPEANPTTPEQTPPAPAA